MPGTLEQLPAWLSNPEKIEALAKIDQETKAAGNKNITADWNKALLDLQLTDLRTSRQLGLAIDGNIPQPQPDKEAFRQVLEDLRWVPSCNSTTAGLPRSKPSSRHL